MLASFLSGEFLLHILCWLHFYQVSFSYISRAGFIFIWGVFLKHPMLASFSSGEFFSYTFLFLSQEFLLHIPCWLYFSLGSFSYTSHVGFIFLWGVSLTHPTLASFFSLGMSLTHPMLASFVSTEVLLHIPCSLCFYAGSFSYTSHAAFIILQGVSLTHPMLS